MMPLLAFALVLLWGQEDVGSRVKQTAYARASRASAIAQDAGVRDAVTASNAVPESAEQVRRRDTAWMANPGDPLRHAILQAPCSARLRELTKDDAMIVEAFVMNDRGTLVCSVAETSDYWQGDEPKWQRTFLEGRDPFVDEPAFDASTGKYAIQISVPVVSGAKRIGAVTLTLKLKRQEAGTAAKQ
jgi:hypothetical protein